MKGSKFWWQNVVQSFDRKYTIGCLIYVDVEILTDDNDDQCKHAWCIQREVNGTQYVYKIHIRLLEGFKDIVFIWSNTYIQEDRELPLEAYSCKS